MYQRGSKDSHEVAENGKLRNASVLGLDEAEAIYYLPMNIGKETKTIPEAKRRLGRGSSYG